VTLKVLFEYESLKPIDTFTSTHTLQYRNASNMLNRTNCQASIPAQMQGFAMKQGAHPGPWPTADGRLYRLRHTYFPTQSVRAHLICAVISVLMLYAQEQVERSDLTRVGA
jgi:hypothetical protein